METQLCANCENEIPVANYSIHVLTCRRHTYRCEKCGVSVPLSGKDEHNEMRHTQETCDTCGDSYLRGDREIHLNVCELGSEVCPYCESEVQRREMGGHTDACGSRTELCRTCGRYVLLRDRDSHVCHSPPPRHDFSQGIGTARPKIENPYQPMNLSSLFPLDPVLDSRRSDFLPPVPSNPRRTEFIPPGPSRRSDSIPSGPSRGSDFIPPGPSRGSEFGQSAPDDLSPTGEPTDFTPPRHLRGPPTATEFIDITEEAPRSAIVLSPDLEPEISAPCEFCGNQVPLVAIEGHQERCKFRAETFTLPDQLCPKCKQLIPELSFGDHIVTCRRRPDRFDRSIGSHRVDLEPKAPESSTLIPCEFCDQLFEMDYILEHQATCGLSTATNIGHFPPKTKCEICKSYFSPTEIGPHREECTRRPPIGKYRPIRSEVTKCKFCLKIFSFDELENHQNICTKNPELIVDKKCVHCLDFFPNHQISDHENTCRFQYRRNPIETSSIDLPFMDHGHKEVEPVKCPYCKFPQPAMDLDSHKNACLKNPKLVRDKKCVHCLESFPNHQISDHENTCGFRYSTNPIESPNIELPFTDHGHKELVEKSKPIDNKCPFCKFPQPAMSLDSHKNACQKNPKFKENRNVFEKPVDIGSDSSGPELKMFSRPSPITNFHQRETKPTQNTLNPFLKDLEPPQRIEQKSKGHYPTRRNPIHKPDSDYRQTEFRTKCDSSFLTSSLGANPRFGDTKLSSASDSKIDVESVYAKNKTSKYGHSKYESKLSDTSYSKQPSGDKSTSLKDVYKATDVYSKPQIPNTPLSTLDNFTPKSYPENTNRTTNDKQTTLKDVYKRPDVYKLYSKQNSPPQNFVSEPKSPVSLISDISPISLFRDKGETGPAFTQKSVKSHLTSSIQPNPNFKMELKGIKAEPTVTSGVFKSPPALSPTYKQYTPETKFAMNPALRQNTSTIKSDFSQRKPEILKISDPKYPRRDHTSKSPELSKTPPDRKVFYPPTNPVYPHTVSNGVETIVVPRLTLPVKKTSGNFDNRYKNTRGSQTDY